VPTVPAGVSAPARAPMTPSGFPGQWAPTPSDWKYPVWPSGCGRFQGDERAACLKFNAEDYGRLARFAAANAALPPAQRGRVVFFGDSITDNWGAPSYGGFFPGQPYVNRGIGGQATSQMLLRFRADVLALHPAAVVILAGTNDISRATGAMTAEMVQFNLMAMTQLAQANGIKAVLCSILPTDDTPMPSPGAGRGGGAPQQAPAGGAPRRKNSEMRPPSDITRLNAWMKDFAAKSGAVYVDYYSAVVDADGMFRDGLSRDGVHPTPDGYAIMAPMVQAALKKISAQ